MFSHVFTGVTDFGRAFAFYNAVLTEIGLSLRFMEAGHEWAGWQRPEGGRPLFVIGKPYDRKPHNPGNGQMVAFQASSREVVRRVYATAMAHGATCEGPPGLRAQYHPNYYGAYFRDPEGNKVCVACHAPEAS
jgi:lactoylglutathione lyase